MIHLFNNKNTHVWLPLLILNKHDVIRGFSISIILGTVVLYSDDLNSKELNATLVSWSKDMLNLKQELTLNHYPLGRYLEAYKMDWKVYEQQKESGEMS